MIEAESEWLASESSKPMLEYLVRQGTTTDEAGVRVGTVSISYRKLRLFFCGCCRLIWDCLSEPSRRAVEATERLADGHRLHPRSWSRLWESNWGSDEAIFQSGHLDDIVAVGEQQSTRKVPPIAQADLLRCVAGNPFREVLRRDKGGNLRHVVGTSSLNVNHWLTPTVLALAQAAYKSTRSCLRCGGKGRICVMDGIVSRSKRYCSPDGDTIHMPMPTYRHEPCPACHGDRTDGLLDPVRLGVLADALSDAGCEDEELLKHLRSPGPHARGCQPLDLILGKD